jgi:hypothetical protein
MATRHVCKIFDRGVIRYIIKNLFFTTRYHPTPSLSLPTVLKVMCEPAIVLRVSSVTGYVCEVFRRVVIIDINTNTPYSYNVAPGATPIVADCYHARECIGDRK